MLDIFNNIVKYTDYQTTIEMLKMSTTHSNMKIRNVDILNRKMLDDRRFSKIYRINNVVINTKSKHLAKSELTESKICNFALNTSNLSQLDNLKYITLNTYSLNKHSRDNLEINVKIDFLTKLSKINNKSIIKLKFLDNLRWYIKTSKPLNKRYKNIDMLYHNYYDHDYDRGSILGNSYKTNKFILSCQMNRNLIMNYVKYELDGYGSTDISWFENIVKMNVDAKNHDYIAKNIEKIKLCKNINQLYLESTNHAHSILSNVPSIITKLELNNVKNIHLNSYSNLELKCLKIMSTKVNINKLKKPYLLEKLIMIKVKINFNPRLFNNIKYIHIIGNLEINNNDLDMFNQLNNLKTIIIDSCPRITNVNHLKKIKHLYLMRTNPKFEPTGVDQLSNLMSLSLSYDDMYFFDGTRYNYEDRINKHFNHINITNNIKLRKLFLNGHIYINQNCFENLDNLTVLEVHNNNYLDNINKFKNLTNITLNASIINNFNVESEYPTIIKENPFNTIHDMQKLKNLTIIGNANTIYLNNSPNLSYVDVECTLVIGDFYSKNYKPRKISGNVIFN